MSGHGKALNVYPYKSVTFLFEYNSETFRNIKSFVLLESYKESAKSDY